MPDFNPAIAAQVNPNPINLGSTVNTLSQLNEVQARTGLLNLQAAQQQRQYNALQAAAQAYRENHDPTASYLAAGGDPAGANSLQGLFANQRAMAQTPGGITPQAYEQTTGAQRNIAETGQIGANTQKTNAEVASKIAGGVIADPSNDQTWQEAVNKHYDTFGGPQLERQQLLAVKDPAQRARIAQAYSGQGVSPDEMNKVTAINPGESYNTPARMFAGTATGQGGAPLVQGLSPQQKETQTQTAAKTIDYLQGEGNKSYSNAQTLLGSLDVMQHDVETLGPSWLGSGADTKASAVKGLNSFLTQFGIAPIQADKISKWEELNKETSRAGMQLINSNFGGSREAASIIQMGKTAVPGSSSTYLGNLYMTSTIRAAAQRQIDLYEYQAQHADKLPAVSAIQFNRQHPPQQYAMKGITDVIPAGAKQYLAAHPETAAAFNKNFGDGTAQFILSNQ